MNKKSQSQPATKSIMYSLKPMRKAFASTKLPPNRSASALLFPRCVLKAKWFRLSSWKSINPPMTPSRGISGWKNTATNRKNAASSEEQAVSPDSAPVEFQTLNTRKAAPLPKPLRTTAPSASITDPSNQQKAMFSSPHSPSPMTMEMRIPLIPHHRTQSIRRTSTWNFYMA